MMRFRFGAKPAGIAGLYALLIAGNVVAWIGALVAFHGHPILIGTGLLAYSFGLRHAVDADHIAAIDNVTRKLMQDGQRPKGVGFFFSLGHATVVVVASVTIAATAGALLPKLSSIRATGTVIGTSISATFLFAIAVANVVIATAIYRKLKSFRRDGILVDTNLDHLLGHRGFLSRFFRPLFGLITKSWHMYPLGFLFGLGFDTASEIGLLAISAAEASKGLSILGILVFPLLFTAGMTLVDTTDGLLMLGAYGWAFVKPARKLYYNLVITSVSAVVAIFVGGIEALGLIAEKLKLEGHFWQLIANSNGRLGVLGYGVIGILLLCWLTSVAIYKFRGYDQLDLEVASHSRGL